MSGIYARQNTKWRASFASDFAVLSLAGDTLKLGVVQSLQLQFSQQIARIYDIGNGGSKGGVAGVGNEVPVYYVGGRTAGSATLARVLGPDSGDLCEFYTRMGNVCVPQDLTFTLEGGCNAASASAAYTISGAVMNNVGTAVNAQDMIVNESISLMFANLDCAAGKTAAVAANNQIPASGFPPTGARRTV